MAPTEEAPLVRPEDEHNRELLANVHPPGWVNPEPAPRYNLVVVGGGTAGLVSAAGAAGLGAKVALVERSLLGGDCLNVGCVPSKAMIRSARFRHDLALAGSLGWRVEGKVEPDFAAVMARMRRLRARLSHHDSAGRFRSLGVDVFLGSGRFVAPDALEVAGKRLRFARAVIATGARAAAPPVPGLAEAGFHTNEDIFWLTERPRALAVIGAGPIGCELAQAFRRLGSEVTLVAPQVLPREDRDAAELVARALAADGIRLLLDARLTRVERTGTSRVIFFEQRGSPGTLAVDAILLGAGRKPNVDGLGLEAAGVRFNARRGVEVDDFLRTSNRRIFAAGDVCLDTKFTHAADAAARIVIQNALFHGRKRWSRVTVPWVTYTDPEVAHVGMYEHEARDNRIGVTTFTRPLSEVDRAVADGEEEGFVRVHVRRGSDAILGATIVARHAGEMIGELAVAMAAGLGLGRLASVVHPYPTQAEAIRQVGDLYNRTRLTPGVKQLFERWLTWTR